ncbi:nitrous oxide reductase family maturation protein NosD [bacterium SCSIO 12741]|nr:nitrous oxide reductase family maturation protein NosD [bacterium SCSIO 12741]
MKALSSILGGLLLLPGLLIGQNIRVSPGGLSLAEAVQQAQPFDQIVVEAGTYFEHGIEIQKPLKITGEPGAIFDAQEQGEILTLHADSITVSGLEFRNIGTSYIKDWAAISSDRCTGCVIENNRLINAFFGIYLRHSDQCIIRGNEVLGQAEMEMSSGNAIHLWYCKDILIDNNKVVQHRDGIYLEFVENSVIQNNQSINNIRYGLHFMFSDKNRYIHNQFMENGSGVAVMYSSFIEMRDNEFRNNWGPAAYGLLLKEIFDSQISHNTFYKNTTAIYGEGAVRTRIDNNHFESNGWAMKILSSCMEDTITGNNFVGNTFSLFTNTPRNYNLYEKNYWSDYSGYDLNHDGIGDVPHRPVSLFTYVVEKSEPAILLLRSHFVGLLEFAEKAAPGVTPESLTDHKPLMNPRRD